MFSFLLFTKVVLGRWAYIEIKLSYNKPLKVNVDNTSLLTHIGSAGDSFGAHNGMAFTTKDVDLDQLKNNNCAVKWRSAWWYNKCRYRCNLNGQYFPKKDYEGVIWEYWEKVESLKKTEMKLRPYQF